MELSFYRVNFYGFRIKFPQHFLKTLAVVRKPALILLLMKHVIVGLFLDFSWVHRRVIWIFYPPMKDQDPKSHHQVQYKVTTIFVIDSCLL